jgi:hypothetical protein
MNNQYYTKNPVFNYVKNDHYFYKRFFSRGALKCRDGFIVKNGGLFIYRYISGHPCIVIFTNNNFYAVGPGRYSSNINAGKDSKLGIKLKEIKTKFPNSVVLSAPDHEEIRSVHTEYYRLRDYVQSMTA